MTVRPARLVLAAGLLAAPAAAQQEATYLDPGHAFTLTHPTGEGWSCGPGAYGAGYEERFGCLSEMFRLVVLVWEAGAGGFDLNVQTSVVSAPRGEVLARIAEAMDRHGYESLVQSGGRSDFEAPAGKRRVAYLLGGDLLIEINARFERDHRSGDARLRAVAELEKIVDSVRFAVD